MTNAILDGESLNIHQVASLAYGPEEGRDVRVTLSDEAWQKVARAEEAVQGILDRGEVVYGVTTGFGAFKDRIIPLDQVEQLQRNILMSHAVGVGPLLDTATTRAMMAIRANTLAKGHSGIRAATLRLLDDPALRAPLGNAARRRVDERFSATSVLPQMEDVYRSVAPGPRG